MNDQVVELPPSESFTAEQALHSALASELTDALIVGYDSEGLLIIRSSKMTRAEAMFLAEHAKRWAMEGY